MSSFESPYYHPDLPNISFERTRSTSLLTNSYYIVQDLWPILASSNLGDQERHELIDVYSTVFREAELSKFQREEGDSSAKGLLSHSTAPGATTPIVLKDPKITTPLIGDLTGISSSPTIFPVLFVPDVVSFSFKLSDTEQQLLGKFYSQPASNRVALGASTGDFARDLDNCAAVNDLWLRLSGRTGDLQELLERFGGTIPVILGPIESNIIDGKLCEYARLKQYRVPYGSLDVSKRFMEMQQNRIEVGDLAKYTVELEGRISAEFLRWACGDAHTPSPIPDIEILYNLQLPSGAKYTFTLKDANGHTQKVQNDDQKWDRADWIIIQLLGAYFETPDNRRSWRFFEEISPDLFSESMRTFAREPNLIATLGEYQRFVEEWRKSVYTRLAEMQEGSRVAYRQTPWMNPEYNDRGYFGQALRQQIAELPVRHKFFAPTTSKLTAEQYFTLTSAEYDDFLRTFEELFYQLCKRERDRVAEEALNGIHTQRIADCYDGPPEGFPQPLGNMVLDMVTSKRRVEDYIAERSGRNRADKSSDDILVPARIKRSYRNPEWFLDPEGVAKYLVEHPPKRTTVVMIDDPQASNRISQIDATPQEAIDHIQENSLGRLANVLNRVIGEYEDQPYKESSLEFAAIRAFGDTIADLQIGIDAANERVKTARDAISTSMPGIVSGFKEQGLKGNMLREKVTEARRKLEIELEGAQAHLRTLRWNALDQFQECWPGAYRQYAIRLHSITDRACTRFIYSIGADSKPIFHPIAGGFARSHSEQLQGQNMYAGGEAHFTSHDAVFHTLEAWQKFDAIITSELKPIIISLTILDNSSGHYEPLAGCLKFAQTIMRRSFTALPIDCSQIKLVDGLAPHLRLRGLIYDDRSILSTLN